ncbi:MAG TPA: CPBP family intramembrane glutamic endopeptidase [Candidatus Sulfotelmatobacter sp.]|nr:CPBP family intramembrane glutamic endopeptidase [Candidatus Sulfotelmatobacter sp.]
MLRLVLLSLEFSALFVSVPLLIHYRLLPNLPIPYLLFAALAAFLVLRSDPSFDSSHLASWNNVRSQLLPLLVRDAVFLAFLGLAVRVFAPQLLFSFLKRAPGFWALVMLLYPLVSVYPQELIYRAFFFHRYQPLFGSGIVMILASAFAFGFVHIIFGNWLAVILCILGGFLFSTTYQHSGSLLFACLDHAIFGNFIFTIGLGQFFYHGSRV